MLQVRLLGEVAAEREGEQTASGWRDQEWLAFAFGGHPSQQPHLQHAPNDKRHLGVCPRLTIR